jgi:hypothetical protein
MLRPIPVALIAVVLTACSASHSSGPALTSTSVRAPRGPTISRTVTPAPKPTLVASIPTPKPSSGFVAFLGSLCQAIGSHDAGTVQNALMNYQYNTGVRYGNLGDGEGQTGDPSILNSWLGTAVIRCRYFTADIAGHGTLLTSGWPLGGGWSLIEMDVVGGSWKINDFTFGSPSALYRAMQTSRPILTYHA